MCGLPDIDILALFLSGVFIVILFSKNNHAKYFIPHTYLYNLIYKTFYTILAVFSMKITSAIIE